MNEERETVIVTRHAGAVAVVERVDEYLPDWDNDWAVEWYKAREAREEIVKTALEVLAGTRYGTADGAYRALCAVIEAGSAYSSPVETIDEPGNRDAASSIEE